MPFAAETAAFPDGTPVTGGRILMGTIGEPSNLIPYGVRFRLGRDPGPALYVLRSSDKDLNVVPWPPRHEVLEGGRLLRFVLRDDIRWRTAPLTADDVSSPISS
ncbi:MAG: hypothetical protein ACLR0N_16005 [Bilophila wadsworthia]